MKVDSVPSTLSSVRTTRMFCHNLSPATVKREKLAGDVDRNTESRRISVDSQRRATCGRFLKRIISAITLPRLLQVDVMRAFCSVGSPPKPRSIWSPDPPSFRRSTQWRRAASCCPSMRAPRWTPSKAAGMFRHQFLWSAHPSLRCRPADAEFARWPPSVDCRRRVRRPPENPNGLSPRHGA